jgi:phage tail protein X
MASIQAIPYTTVAGDRWDLLAWLYYGDPTNYQPIIDANPYIGISPVLPQGLKIFIPIIAAPAPATNKLPPWGSI